MKAGIIGEILTGLMALLPRGGGVLPYMGYIGMCHCEGYGFQTVYSRIGYIRDGPLGNLWGGGAEVQKKIRAREN